jgi:hypothetical protein
MMEENANHLYSLNGESGEISGCFEKKEVRLFRGGDFGTRLMIFADQCIAMHQLLFLKRRER